MNTKTQTINMRVSEYQKSFIKEQAEKKSESVTEYLWNATLARLNSEKNILGDPEDSPETKIELLAEYLHNVARELRNFCDVTDNRNLPLGKLRYTSYELDRLATEIYGYAD